MNTLLVRHTKTAVPEGLCYGRTDVPLADTFATEAAAVRAALPPPPWRIVSSPAARCRQLAETFDAPVAFDERLCELDFGEWENRLWADLPRAQTEPWLADFVHCRPPGGESFGELAARAAAVLLDLTRLPDDRPLVVVTHAGVIRALLAAHRRIPLGEAFRLPVAFGSVHTLTAFNSPIHPASAPVAPA